MEVIKSHKCFAGLTQFWQHDSRETKTKMKFSTFTPPGKPQGCLIWLSGLTCTEENFITKAGAQRYLAEHDLMVICPDTSPRGLNLPGEHESYDFGSGAGFYVDATTPGYRDHYRMYSYVVSELYALIEDFFKIKSISIFGHSMGGHGALVMGLRENKFKSVSAFSPIVHPSAAPWGQKALPLYLGEQRANWLNYDACELVRSGHKSKAPVLIDQGTGDEFLAQQLRTEDFAQACAEAAQPVQIQMREGYDHSYYFISTFIGSHVAFHAQSLKS